MSPAAETMARPGKVKHVVADGPHWTSRTDGPMTCSCGWEGMSSAFQQHRTGSGQRRPGGFATSDRIGPNEHSWKPEYPPVTRRQGPKDEAAEPMRVNRGFGRSYPTPKEETVTKPLADGEKMTAGTCVICGTGFEYRRRGYARLTCSDEHRRERDRRIKRGEDVSLHPKGQPAVQHSQILVAASAPIAPLPERSDSGDQVLPAADLAPAEHENAPNEVIPEPAPSSDQQEPEDHADVPEGADRAEAVGWDEGYAAGLAAAADVTPAAASDDPTPETQPLGDQIRIGGIEIALEEAERDLATATEAADAAARAAEEATGNRNIAIVAVSYLRSKLASLQA